MERERERGAKRETEREAAVLGLKTLLVNQSISYIS